jgi:hypothetical protein
MDDKLRQLEDRIRRLEQALEKAKVFEPYVPEDLAQGDDIFSIYCEINITLYRKNEWAQTVDEKKLFLDSTWSEIFKSIAPCFIIEGTIEPESEFYYSLQNMLIDKAKMRACKPGEHLYLIIRNYELIARKIIVQFMALNLIDSSKLKHSITDKNEYYSLTEYGKNLMLQVSPIKHQN